MSNDALRALDEVEGALLQAEMALRQASRQLTEEHRIVLNGARWGGPAIDRADCALSLLPTLRAALTPSSDGEALHFRFSKNDHGPLLTFVEAENAEGYSVCVGEWSDDGEYRMLTIPNPYKLRATLLPLAERCAAAEVEVLRRLAPEYFQWPGKNGVDCAPEWLQHRLKYGGASVDGDMLEVYDWHDRRSLAAPDDYVVDGEKGLWVLPARADLSGETP